MLKTNVAAGAPGTLIRERYDPISLFELVSLACRFEPELAQLDRHFDEDTLFPAVKADLARRHPRSTQTGRPATPGEVVLRRLIVKHLSGGSSAETERLISDRLVLRQFPRGYLAPVPDDTTLLRWANRIQPRTLHGLLDRAAQLPGQPGAASGPVRPRPGRPGRGSGLPPWGE